MHSTGSIIKTYCEKVRHYLDDPDLDAKYDDNYLVRFFMSSACRLLFTKASSSARLVNQRSSTPHETWYIGSLPFVASRLPGWSRKCH